MEIIIGTKVWSSWSMRPWLVLKHTGVAFDERVVPLRQHGSAEAIHQHSPSGLVPALKDGDLTIWDSLAICEYLAEKFPGLWPSDPAARALARAVSAEMHSGFHSLRGECSMDLAATPKPVPLSELTHADIRRIVQLVAATRQQFGGGGEFLFGQWSIADAFYTPVATRFKTYGVLLSDFGDRGDVGRYMEALLETPECVAWTEAALKEAA
ncbi:MAG: glutathione S-transferase family protein [Caulobacteraceae bacterium]